MLGADSGYCAGTHVGDTAGIEDRLWRPGPRIEQRQYGEFGRKAKFVVIDKVADHLHPRGIDRLLDRAAQHVEMSVRNARLEMHSWLDHRLSAPLAGKARLVDNIASSVILSSSISR